MPSITRGAIAEMDWLSERQLAGAVLDALTSSICVIDSTGIIVAVNEPWRRFSNDYGGKDAFLRALSDLTGSVRAL